MTMGPLRRVLRLLFAFAVAAWVASAAWAVASRRRFVPSGTPDTDLIELGAFYDELEFHSRATAFRGGSVRCGFGGGVLDLSGATMHPAGAKLHLTAIFGGAQVLVPASWRVETHGAGLFGGIVDARPDAARLAHGPVLRIEGIAFFGGFVVQAVTERRMRPTEASDPDLPEVAPVAASPS
jgi:hypothetical protein